MARARVKRIRTHKVKILWILILACVLVVGLIGILSIKEWGSEEKKVAQEFSVPDECSLVMGNLIHQMKNDADCKIRCHGECQVREMDFVNHSFTEKFDSCHTCDCYCI